MTDPMSDMPLLLALPAWAAALAATLYLARTLWKGVRGTRRVLAAIRKAIRKLDALDELARRELEHNHGSSMKDDVHGMAVALGLLQRNQDQLRRDFDQHVARKDTR